MACVRVSTVRHRARPRFWRHAAVSIGSHFHSIRRAEGFRENAVPDTDCSGALQHEQQRERRCRCPTLELHAPHSTHQCDASLAVQRFAHTGHHGAKMSGVSVPVGSMPCAGAPDTPGGAPALTPASRTTRAVSAMRSLFSPHGRPISVVPEGKARVSGSAVTGAGVAQAHRAYTSEGQQPPRTCSWASTASGTLASGATSQAWTVTRDSDGGSAPQQASNPALGHRRSATGSAAPSVASTPEQHQADADAARGGDRSASTAVERWDGDAPDAWAAGDSAHDANSAQASRHNLELGASASSHHHHLAQVAVASRRDGGAQHGTHSERASVASGVCGTSDANGFYEPTRRRDEQAEQPLARPRRVSFSVDGDECKGQACDGEQVAAGNSVPGGRLQRGGTGRSLDIGGLSHADDDAMSHGSAKRTHFAAMPRVSVAMWDDVTDGHVPDDTAQASDEEGDDKGPLSPIFRRVKGIARAVCCKRVVRRTWSGVFPGSLESRKVYEQLKWAPVVPTAILMLVPLCFDGEALNLWTFSLAFHVFYLWASLAVALSTFGLLYPLPPVHHMVTYAGCMTVTYMTLVALAMSFLSGQALVFVLPAILMFLATFTLIFLLHSAVSTCVVPVMPAHGLRTPSTWDVITGRVPVHTRRRPVVGPGTPKRDAVPVHKFVVNADALLPLRRLFIAFCVMVFAYYWFQVYTRSVAFDLHAVQHDQGVGSDGFGVVTILVFEFVLFCFRRLMRVVMSPVSLMRVGIPELSARAVSTVMTYSVVLCGAFFERLLFMQFESLSAVGVAVLQRTLIHVATDVVFMSSWYYRLRSSALRIVCKRKPVPALSFADYLYDQQALNMYAHVANFTSMVTWGLALLWFRYGYNAPVFAFGSQDLPGEIFWRLLQYAGIIVLGELGELLFVRLLAVCRCDSVLYFNRALRPMQHWAARVAFVAMAAHMLEDGMVALVQLEPNTA